MKLYLMLTLGFCCILFFADPVLAQNINTNTTSTTVGSTQFGTLLSPADLGVIMQSTVAPTCTGPNDARDCGLFGLDGIAGTNDDFFRKDAMPGAYTSSALGIVSVNPNFACGPTVSSTSCVNLMQNTSGMGGPQTGVNFTGRDLVGQINTDIRLGDGTTAGMPDGFLRFTLDPATGDASIDQLIDHQIDLGGGNVMDFVQRDATIGVGNLIPDPIRGPLTLLPFTAPAQLSGGLGDVGLVSRLQLKQGAADGFGGLNLDVSANFPAGAPGKLAFPSEGMFVTPGLNTGIDSSLIPGLDGIGFP